MSEIKEASFASTSKITQAGNLLTEIFKNPKFALRRLGQLLGRNSTEPLSFIPAPSKSLSFDQARMIDAGREDNVNEFTFDNSILSREIYERPSDNTFADILDDVDRYLFEGKKFAERGWRHSDVKVGTFIHPRHQNVPELLQLLSDKVTYLYKQDRSIYNPRLAAWTAWALINIHPKTDGNGRLTKGVVSYFMGKAGIVGWRSELWNSFFRLSDSKFNEEVSRRTGVPIPNGSQSSIDFYRHEGRDVVAEILKDAIEQTDFDKSGGLEPAYLSKEALDLFVRFISDASDRRILQK